MIATSEQRAELRARIHALRYLPGTTAEERRRTIQAAHLADRDDAPAMRVAAATVYLTAILDRIDREMLP